MPIVIDGGLSTALAQAGHDLDHPLWTARLVVDEPQAIVAAHLAYLRAGARVLVTASYQASAAGFVADGQDAEAAVGLLARTTALAREAVERFAAEDPMGAAATVVAASVGPYGAVLADGSEYRGDYAISYDELVVFHRERSRVLVASAPDLLAIETIPGVIEAQAIAEALRSGDAIDAWCAFSCRSGSETCAGDPIEDAVAAALGIPGLVAVGVNCTAPEHVDELLTRIRAVTSLPLVVYPNLGAAWDGAAKRWVGPGADAMSAAAVRRWSALGTRYVGGCCGTGPVDIARLAAVAVGNVTGQPREPIVERGTAD
jgi:homocysteine S-methyltransferase